ncbi:MAG: hypothetical protein ACRERD_05275 [Candidatus Binatia bacterium]
MDAETIQQGWEWLLSLSKVQLVLLGGAVALLVAVSKILRFLFLLGLLIVFFTTFFPELSKYYEESPLPAIVESLLGKVGEATQDPAPAELEPKE